MAAGRSADSWKLASGHWAANAAGNFEVLATPDGSPVAKDLEFPDAETLAGGLRPDGRIHPPEFAFDPLSGERLATGSPALGWLPPFGMRPAPDRRVDHGGLRITCEVLRVERTDERTEVADPDREMPRPPSGCDEFFSVPVSNVSAALVALNKESGQVCLWGPGSERWVPVRMEPGAELARSALAHDRWRCESHEDADGRFFTLFLPTVEGLAALRIDPLKLSARVAYRNAGECLVGPVRWRDRIWVIRSGGSGPVLDGFRSDEEHPSARFDVPHWPDGSVIAPAVFGARHLIWPLTTGCLVLEASARGDDPVLSFRPWPDGFKPAFELGSPFLDGTQLWQTGWSEKDDAYLSVRIDAAGFERRPLSGPPRLCTGRVSYRLSKRMRYAPWIEPEHGTDGDARSVFVPMLESGDGAAVFGVRADWTGSLKDLLESPQKCSAVLELHTESGSEVRLFRLNISRPWEGRVFCHDRTLWFFHRGLTKLIGWKVGQ